MGGFGKTLATLVTLLVACAGAFLQIERWRLDNYNMYDSAVSDIEGTARAEYLDPGEFAVSVASLTKHFSDFLGGCTLGELEVGGENSRVNSAQIFGLCPMNSAQTTLLALRLEDLTCNRLSELYRHPDALLDDGTGFTEDVLGSLSLAKERYGVGDGFGCPLPELEPATVSYSSVSYSSGGYTTTDPLTPDEPSENETRENTPLEGQAVEEGLCSVDDPCRLFTHLAAPVARHRELRPTMEAYTAELVRAAPSVLPGVNVLGPELVRTSVARPSLRYLKSEDEAAANRIAQQLVARSAPGCEIEVRNLSGVYGTNPKVRGRTFELWLNPEFLARCLANN